MQDAQSVFFESLIVVACVCSIVRLRTSRSASTCFYCLGLCFPAFSSSVAVVYFGWCVRRRVVASKSCNAGRYVYTPRDREWDARVRSATTATWRAGVRRAASSTARRVRDFPSADSRLRARARPPPRRARRASGVRGVSPVSVKILVVSFRRKVRPPQVARSWRRPWSRPTAPSRT